jgi:hypothetical protein
VAVALLSELIALYLHYIDDHVSRLTAAGRPELARGFEHWRSRLQTAAGRPTPVQ